MICRLYQTDSTQNGVYLIYGYEAEWLKTDFEDDPIVDTKTKSTAATAAAMIRKDKQMASNDDNNNSTRKIHVSSYQILDKQRSIK